MAVGWHGDSPGTGPPASSRLHVSRASRSAILATVSILMAWLAVALMASRPDSPLTPPLPRDGQAPGFLAEPARALGLHLLPRDVASLICAAIMVGASAAFLYGLLQAWRGRLSVINVIVVGVVLHAVAVTIPVILSRDVYSYIIYGRAISEYGSNPYVSVPADFPGDPVYEFVSPKWREQQAVYGPAFVSISGGITALTDGDPARSILAFKLMAALANLTTAFLVLAAVRRAWPQRTAFAGAALVWNPAVVLHGVAGGHPDALVGTAVAAAALLLVARRELAATAALVLGTLIKLAGAIPLFALVAVAVARRSPGERLRALGTHVGVAAAITLAFVLPYMQSENPSLGLLNLAGHQSWLAPSRLLAVTLRDLGRSTGAPAVGEVLFVAVRVAFPALYFLALAAVVRHLARNRKRVTPLVVLSAMAWTAMLGLMASPILLPWYITWLLPLVWVMPRPARVGSVAMAVGLAVTELIPEPTPGRQIGEALVLGFHYVTTVLVLALMVRLLWELRSRVTLVSAPGLDMPLLRESWTSPRWARGLFAPGSLRARGNASAFRSSR